MIILKTKEIIKAWASSINPTESQKSIAEKRLKICKYCLYSNKKRFIVKKIAYCRLCKCPLNKKVFTDNIHSCPKDKWKNIK